MINLTVNEAKPNIAGYFFAFLLLSQAAFPMFVGNEFLIIELILAGVYFVLTGEKFDSEVLILVLILSVIVVLQGLAFANFAILPFLALLGRIFLAYFSVKIIKPHNFAKVFIDLMYIFGIIGLVLTLMFSFVESLQGFVYDNLVPFFDFITVYDVELLNRKHIMLYTLAFGDYGFPILRNSGPFWEPGANGIYLNLALALNLVSGTTFFSKKNIVFILAILSTQSTAAYPVLGVICLAWIMKDKSIFVNLWILPIFGILVFYLFDAIPFLGEKTQGMINQSTGDLSYISLNRFGSARLNINSFLESPIWGRIFFEKDSILTKTGNNGLTMTLATFGIFGFTYIMLRLYNSLSSLVKTKNPQYWGFLILFTLWMGGMSQSIFNKPFFWGLIVLGFTNIREKISK